MYNKDAVLEWLLDKNESSVAAQVIPHVQSLKDVVELHFGTSKNGDWICPLSQREVKALTYRFVYVAESGWVYSESAIKEFKECPQTSVPFSDKNLVLINPIRKEDKDAAKERMDKLTEQGLSHSLKKMKKEKKEKKEKKDKKDKKKKEYKVVKP
ncbi:hypothetical protein CJU90_5007 [Yarrowia sp. C11]|nr:hypothetical protein CJU90_5007 [Yarrowia sp. C11]